MLNTCLFYLQQLVLVDHLLNIMKELKNLEKQEI